MGLAIEIEDLWFKYPLSEDWVLKGIDIDIKEGEFVAIMGPSGCGKSTLLYILAGIIPNMIRGEIGGSVKVLGKEILNLRPEEIVRNIGFVFQNPDSQLLMPTAIEEVIMGLENLGLPREEILARAWNVIKYVGLEGKARQSPRSLSAGEKQILAIASVLALKPKILILDEPTSMLDHIGTAKVLGLIERLKREAEITTIVVEHRIEWAVEVADKIAIMNDGRIEAYGDPREVFGNPNLIRKIGIRPPMISEVFYRLAEDGIEIHRIPITVDEGVKTVKEILGDRFG
ncbi:MAG: ATP-binding cassette domain-containing protein [Desulfurococcales archaeon]|jgi:energy-coupling factor transport system ATP-binding protein|nr:ATP-binding cassette domain-containing protein [Desulfurococcales archaeon]